MADSLASSSPSPAALSKAAQPGFFHEMRQFWQVFFVAAFDPYRPEQHYMRGPGPACQAKSRTSAGSDISTSH